MQETSETGIQNLRDEIRGFVHGLQRNKTWKRLVLLLGVMVSMVSYMYLNPPINPQIADFATRFIALPGDFPVYIWRFIMSLLLLGILPLTLALVLGFKPAKLGLSWNWSFLKSRLYWLIFVLFVIIGVSSSRQADIFHFYPFAKSLVPFVKAHPWIFLIHILLYVGLYYLPWEILFRGILVFPFMSIANGKQLSTLEQYPAILIIAAMQTMPTTLMHLPHPIAETLGAIPFGIACGFLAIRYRSILAPLFVHATVGILLDLTIILST